MKTSSKSSSDQVESVVTEKRKKSLGRQKSPARTKSPGRKSPARTSPARTSPARTKPEPTKRSGTPTRTSTRTRSPARLRTASPVTSTPILIPSRRSPIRRSPARAAKEPSEDKEKVDRLVSDVPALRTRKQKIIIDTDTDSDNTESVPEVKEKPKATGGFKHLDTEEINSLGLVRRFTRASQNREVERVVHLKHFDSMVVTKRLGEFSDEDEMLAKKTQPELQKLPETQNRTEFGGVYGVLVYIIAIPTFLIAFYILSYFDAKSFLGVIAHVTLLAILSVLPFGGPKVSATPNKHSKFEYVANGSFCFVIVLLICCGLELKNIPIVDYVINHIFHLLIAYLTLGCLLSVYNYISSFYVPVSALNTHAVGKNAIYGFFMGREINPRISSLDIKILCYRVVLTRVVLFDFAYLYASLNKSVVANTTGIEMDPKLITIQPTLLIYVLLHSVYFLDAIIFEAGWITSFEIQEEAFGYMLCMTYTLYPFLTAAIAKYIVEHGVELASWQLALLSLLFAIGYIVYRGSNSQKNAFRRNPYSPALSHLETIPTTRGKKLLVSGFWGIVRHPNYAADILIHLTFIPFAWPGLAVIYPFFIIMLLLYRSVRDNARCKEKYGAAWDRYCNRVKYILLPKVY
ncbi:hypothetical protein NQ314_013366 [Rhamnusium bicolor]|uniref:Delta(14)-sterol reductase n=1 Tax=Rhamnusium bicolor TaxID=1586634 RepID=A0AAV8X6K1_9CUCU|nr:hypothetical protein NQ314_013366 [Rhamnusium bicolor]